MKLVIIAPQRSRFSYRADQPNLLGGIEAACVELAQAMTRRGHQVQLATSAPDQISIPGVTSLGFADLAGLEGDVALSCNDARYLGDIRHGLKITWMHNPIDLGKAIRKKQWLAMAKTRPHAVFGSQYALNHGSAFLPFASRSVIPLGIDPVFQTMTESRPRKPLFIWVSQPQRGLSRAITAWRMALKALPAEAEFHIYSATPEQGSITADEAARLGIRFLPRIGKQALLAVYQEATALISLGAHDETFCLAAAEAVACGLPVLTHGIGSLRERVQHGVNGLISRDVAGLAQDMIRLSRDDELRRLLSEGGKRHAQDYHWDRVAKLWEDYLYSLGAPVRFRGTAARWLQAHPDRCAPLPEGLHARKAC